MTPTASAAPLTAAIVDDEPHCIETLAWDLKTYAPHCSVIGSFTDPREALAELPSLNADVLFLDIEMPHLNGFELLSHLQEMTSHLIFTTAYSQYAVKAFRHSAVDYLLKPVDGAELAAALAKVSVDPARNRDPNALKVLFDQLSLEEGRSSKLSLPTADGWELVSIAEIIHCQSDGSYSYIFLSDGRKLTISRNLKQLEDPLSEYGFQRVHHRHLVNVARIRKVMRNGALLMSDGSEVMVSRAKKDQVMRLIQ